MKSKNSRICYELSGKRQPESWQGGNIPPPYSNEITTTIPRSTLKTPPGFLGKLKGFLGQRFYMRPGIPAFPIQ